SPAPAPPGDPHPPGERPSGPVRQRGVHHPAARAAPKESEALLGFLFEHITRPEFQVRWRWQENDIAIWDNRVTQHYANADYLPARRVMHRATILGDKPFWRPG
ncbi:hypothetical protein DA11_07030, partial [Aeromonas caviae]